MRYWVEECHVDGFRFDLAVSLTRDRDAVDFNSPFLDAVIQDPVLAKVKMISESWDLGKWGYQVGNFPPGWAEWNGRFRDHVRAYVKGDDNTVDDFARNFLGSGDIFDRRGRRPWASINFITAHDGFTLADLYAYNEKHNEANGEDNRDGHDDNRSWNCGVEGPTDDPAILALRDRMRRFAMTRARRQPGRADAADGRRERPHAAAATTTPTARTTSSPGWTGAPSRASRRSAPSSPAPCGCAASWPCSPRRTGSAARRSREGGLPGRALAAARRRRRCARQDWTNGLGEGARHPARQRRGEAALVLSNASFADVTFMLPRSGPARPAGGCGSTAAAATIDPRRRRRSPPAPTWRWRRAACGSIRGSAAGASR